MKIYDLSPEISEEMIVYKDKAEKKPKIKAARTLKEGSNESRIELDSHTGSHVDAPYHMLENGKTIEKIPLEKFMGKCIVLDFTKIKNSITKNNIKNSEIKIKKNGIVLLKTKNKSERSFNQNFTYLDKSGAEYLVSKKIKAVGIDSLGIERNQPEHETHKILLRNNIPIFEGLDLSKVNQGRYFFHGLPLKIRKGDASPVRAVLIME
ncbi:cyclase family protein [Candidatus Woesearchaeota archaeon]|nr:cyclase family protein [Candidatus Woesearchaeota archaeon]